MLVPAKKDAQPSEARVSKVEFSGSLGKRTLYIYLPPGYDESERAYPVLYLQDGQNCFEAFAGDAFSGTWRADETATSLILAGDIEPSILVGVSNGGDKRLEEYLPPYSRLLVQPEKRWRYGLRRKSYVRGRAHQLFEDYRAIDRLVAKTYRTLPGREHRATCGSSMGGLFSAYLAFDHPEFARHHGVLSASFWVTETREGSLQMLERFGQQYVRDMRLWLDSGEGEGDSDDNMEVTVQARNALLEAGYEEGSEFVYHFFPGATHSEAAWAERFPLVLRYLFPPETR